MLAWSSTMIRSLLRFCSWWPLKPQSNPLSVGDTNFFGVRNAERTTKQRRESYKSQKPEASADESSERLPSTCTPLGSATAEASPPSLGLCRHYFKGYCRNGNKCQWSHVAEEAPTEEAPVAGSRCCLLQKPHEESYRAALLVQSYLASYQRRRNDCWE